MYYLLFYFLGLITLPFIFFITILPDEIADWKQKRDYAQAEACYQTAAAMIPHHITPSYKLFQLYIDKGNINAAIDMGNYLLKQPIKKKGTKALRMEAEILEFLHKEKNIKKTQ